MRGIRLLVGMLGASFICLTGSAEVKVIDLGNLGGTPAMAYPEGMSSSGNFVVGRSLSPDGYQAFRWDLDSGQMTGLQHDLGPDALRTRAYDVTTDGSLIVGECTLANGYTQCMLWDSAGAHLYTSEYGGAIYGVSDDGTSLAMTSTFQDGAFKKLGSHVWFAYGTPEQNLLPLPIWEPPVSFPPGSLSGSLPHDISADGSVLVGISMTSMARNAVRWKFQPPTPQTASEWIVHTFEDYPESESSYAYGVSADGGTVVGLTMEEVELGENETEWQWRAFKWTESTGLDYLQPLPGHFYSEARAISNDGSVIAGSSGVDGPSVAVYWDEQGAVYELTNEVQLPSGWHLGGVTAVSEIGTTLTGWGTNANGSIAWIMTDLYRDSLQDAEDRGDGWAESSTYGFFWRAGKSHVWHAEHGWEYIPKGNRDFIIVYDYALKEWTWTNDQSYPFMYKFGEDASWMWYAKGCTPGERWFFHYGKEKWVIEANLSGG